MWLRDSRRPTSQLGTRICVSATLADQVKGFRGRPIGDLVLRGKTEPLRVFEPLRAEQYRDTANKSYLDAFAKLEAGGQRPLPRSRLMSDNSQRISSQASISNAC